MPRRFDFGRRLNLQGGVRQDPRAAMIAVIGALLAVNLAAAAMACNLFGRSAGDLLGERDAVRGHLAQGRARLATGQRLLNKMDTARQQGDRFLDNFVIDERTVSSVLLEELTRIATDSGIKMGQVQISQEPVEGSDTLSMVTIQAGFEGPYGNLARLIDLLDRSPRFLIIENMQANVRSGGGGDTPRAEAGPLNVTLKIDAFVKNMKGDT